MQAVETYDIESLWVDSVFAVPVSIDWREAWNGGDGWDSFEAPDCPECGSYGTWNSDEHAWTCPKEKCDQHGAEIDPDDLTGPVMNYYYSLPDLNRVGDEYEAASRIADLPLCVVTFEDGSHALALTGGGMDFSWEIAEAFTRLGFLPPLHFCDLPRMAGYPRTDEHRHTIAACKRSAEVARYRAARVLESLNEYDV